jgi:hypothetical protein
METKKERLIKALNEERERFKNRGQSTKEHDIAIDYLISGSTNKDSDDWELLDACMNDFETTCSDYGVE